MSSEDKPAAGGATLSENEAALYDRQIRLWGVEAQNRLRNANVLVAGLTGTGAEICKNLVLAGVGVTLQDSNTVDVKDLGAQFFLTQDDVGKNRAEASQSKVQELNPLVKVGCVTKALADFDKSDVEPYDVVCLVCSTYEEKVHINKLCRESSVGFMISETLGLDAYLFVDLGDKYSFVKSQKVTSSEEGEGDTVKQTEATLSYCSLEAAMKVPWDKLPTNKRKRVPETFFALHVLKEGKENLEESANKRLKKLAEAYKLNADDTKLFDPTIVVNTVTAGIRGAEVSPVCAVMGGIVGQELLKAISRKDEPIQNFFFFQGLEAKGTVRLLQSAA